MYALGQGVDQDKAEAERWSYRAATASNLRAPPPPAQVARAADPEPEPPAAEPARPAPRAATPVAKAQPAPRPKPAAKARPRQDPAAQQAQIEQLLASHWLKGSRPALYLPSSETRCHDEQNQLVCHSETRRSSLMGRAYGFRIVATLSNFDGKGGFSVSYRPEVTGVLQAGPGGYGAAEEGGDAISEEQLRERVERDPHDMDCRLSDPRTINCKDEAGKTFEYTGVEPSKSSQPDAVVFNTPLPGSGQTGAAARPWQQPLLAAPAGFQRIRIAARLP
jgi:hypothetical protein